MVKGGMRIDERGAEGKKISKWRNGKRGNCDS
jgi:hypothetical protein